MQRKENKQMKKEYKKPIAVVESFQLDAAIAGSCKEDADALGKKYEKLNYSPDSCTFLGEFFGDGNCQTDLTGEIQGDLNDTVCYHGPLEGYVFIYS